jgi:hypothetical protein
MTRTHAGLLALSVFAISGAFVAACGGGKPAESAASAAQSASAPPVAEPPSASVTQAPSMAPATEPATAPPASAQAPLAAVLATDPVTIQKLFDDTTHAPAATLKTKGAEGGDVLAKGLRELAKRVAPGMEPDGPLATGKLKEKQSVQTDVTLEPGKCYAIVGYSKKVKDLDLYLLLSGILSGQDTTDDSSPVIGASPQPMCPVAATAVTYKLGIVADQGAGEVAVQLYSKGK